MRERPKSIKPRATSRSNNRGGEHSVSVSVLSLSSGGLVVSPGSHVAFDVERGTAAYMGRTEEWFVILFDSLAGGGTGRALDNKTTTSAP